MLAVISQWRYILEDKRYSLLPHYLCIYAALFLQDIKKQKFSYKFIKAQMWILIAVFLEQVKEQGRKSF